MAKKTIRIVKKAAKMGSLNRIALRRAIKLVISKRKLKISEKTFT